jgi:virginiamycin B lyase
MRRLVTGVLVGVAFAVPLEAQQPVTIDEWTVPWGAATRPRDPFVDREGRVWFVGQAGHYIGVLDVASGEFRRYELEPGTGPHNLIVASNGMVWFAGNRVGYIGRLDPATGAITRYPMPDSTVRDPHTLVFDRRGDIWFTAQGGNAIGRLSVASGEVRLVRASAPRSRPYGIAMDHRLERPWAVLSGTNKVATVDPATFELREYELPRAAARPRRVAVTSDGAVWYDDYAGGMLGRLDPVTGGVEEWPLPGGATSRPYALIGDNRDRVWIVETGSQPNVFVGFDTRTRQFLPSRPVPSGGGTVRHMYFEPATQTIWFGTDVGTIGRANLPRVATVP